MHMDEIVGKLREIMQESAEVDTNWDEVGAGSSIADLGFDSLSVLDLTYDIQNGFEIDFEPEALASVKSVGELAEFISKSINSK